MRIDVALMELSPPDSHGFCSFGVGVDTSLTAARCARHVVAQINDQMPRTYGDSFIHVSRIDEIIESSRPLCAARKPTITDTHIAIARNVAGLIEDGAVIQTGIGAIPDAVLSFLMDRKDLGVHSELVSRRRDSAYRSGRDHRRPQDLQAAQDHRGIRAGDEEDVRLRGQQSNFRISSHGLYQPSRFHRAQRQDGGDQLGAADRFDRTGLLRLHRQPVLQRHRRAGGLPARGVTLKGGKPIIAMSSTAKNGTVSRIVPMLSPGAGVVTSRGLVRYVVTEYGVAYLHGKSIRERAKALIEIAHPEFRDQLYHYCEQTKWLQPPVAAMATSR